MSATIDEAPVDLTEELSLHIGQLVSSKGGCFSCGGSIPVAIQPGGKSDRLTSPSAEGQTSGPAETAGSVMDSDVKTTSKPVTVRWDPPSAPPGECRSACFPLSACGTGTGMARLKALLQDCEPATFGRGRQDILDESYRKATKLDASAFAADFCPYSLGIVNTAAELLMPGVGLGWSRAVEAELYKLNVYAAPSGFFKPHVDTPRSEQQFGSLVVCLPCVHKGGALVVRHDGRSVTYDWSTTDEDAPAIKWAAFYSDCEHEVLDVTEGHRVTLTYNLYAVPRRIRLEGKTEGLDVTGLPLYHAVKDALGNPNFLSTGGIIGCYCHHWYPHAAESPKEAPMFPSILKGSDLFLYCVFVALGLEVEIRPVLTCGDEDEYGEYLGRQIDYVGELGCGVGAYTTYVGGNDETTKEIYAAFGPQKKIHWLNAPDDSTRQDGFYYPSYGNHVDLGTCYTYAALLVSIRRNGAVASAGSSAAQLSTSAKTA